MTDCAVQESLRSPQRNREKQEFSASRSHAGAKVFLRERRRNGLWELQDWTSKRTPGSQQAEHLNAKLWPFESSTFWAQSKAGFSAGATP